MRKNVAFFFVPDDGSGPPEPWLSIETPRGRVKVPRRVASDLSIGHGAFVAFYVREYPQDGSTWVARVATHVFPADREHPLVIARAVLADGLVMPDHVRLVEELFEALEGLDGTIAGQDGQLLAQALTRLSSDTRVPEHVRTRARVERMRLGSGDTPSTNAATAPRHDAAPRKDPPAGGSLSRRRPGRPALGNIDRLDLNLD